MSAETKAERAELECALREAEARAEAAEARATALEAAQEARADGPEHLEMQARITEQGKLLESLTISPLIVACRA